jgi:hypothetical protein
MKTFSLQEYRISHPQTAAFPTLTQNRDLAVMLERINRKRQARERRAAWLRQMRETTAQWARLLWSEATHTRTPVPRYVPTPTALQVPVHARAGAGIRHHAPALVHA